METFSETFDGKTYECKPFTATEALVMVPRIISLLGAPVANLFFEHGADGLKKLATSEGVGIPLFVSLMERADEQGGLGILKDLLKNTTYLRKHQNSEGELVTVREPLTEIFDEHFTLNLAHLLQVSAWVATKSFQKL